MYCAEWYPTLFDPMDCSWPSSSVHGASPDKNTGMSCHTLLQGIFPTQRSNPGLLHCRQILYHLSHQGNPEIFQRELIAGMMIQKNGSGIWKTEEWKSPNGNSKNKEFMRRVQRISGTSLSTLACTLQGSQRRRKGEKTYLKKWWLKTSLTWGRKQISRYKKQSPKQDEPKELQTKTNHN